MIRETSLEVSVRARMFPREFLIEMQVVFWFTVVLVVLEDVHCALEHVAVDNGCAMKLTVELIYSVSHDKV